MSSCSVTHIRTLQTIALNYNTVCLPCCFDVKCDVAKETQKNENNTTLIQMELNTHGERQCWKQRGSNERRITQYSSFTKLMKTDINFEFLKIIWCVKEKFKLYFNINFLQTLSIKTYIDMYGLL